MRIKQIPWTDEESVFAWSKEFYYFCEMKDYIGTNIVITPWSQDISDYLSALLGDIGYDSFSTEESTLYAYIYKESFDKNALHGVAEEIEALGYSLVITNEIIEGKDWNQEWEQNQFKPIVISNQCVVRSTSHAGISGYKYEIIVNPRMTFGSGNHATTQMMMEYILENDFDRKSVIDMGAGTGILAILCCLKGAQDVYGIEIDSNAYKNACENASCNSVHPHFICGDAHSLKHMQPSNYFFANINRNIIVADMHLYREKITKGGKFVCSGFYITDLELIEHEAEKYGMHLKKYITRDDWVRAEFSVR